MRPELIKKGNCFGLSVNYALVNFRGENYTGHHLWTFTVLFWMWELRYPEKPRNFIQPKEASR